ncbi:hypothetical protein CPB83DRAFT_832331 [Crepidotus variabilis]|uniref:N-acetyltransferase domain-containing protein n=1 Tax=Crepidotus variabilis TaxID=179855 RepID=A0A9P6EQJ9_9AGAR|nr:hypothetical protein CPB83DRAFT_832331 [Crepidotus variabilis]
MSDITTTYVLRQTLRLVARAKPYHISPISDLPPELLIEIFHNCVSNESLVPLVLRQVSWCWRELVDSAPTLWQTIVLDDSDSKIAEQQAMVWTERSQPLKYDVVLNIEDADQILPLLSPLLPSVDRWRHLSLSAKRSEEIVMGDMQITFDSLTHLHLCLHDYDHDDLDEDDPRITFSPISPGHVSNYALNMWISRIPPRTILPPLRFVHVTIAEGGSVGLHTQPKYILEFLTACPDLESFYLSGFPHDGPIEGPLPSVDLPNLLTLHLKSTCFARAILSSLNTPRLENLYLSHLNVDFDLHSQYDEHGDSEDEANDYSQSPSSDRATGMGLRKLITRCNPPIRILEMDFCDMRTKDFRWVFDRLSTLEDFYIVASDMSNKVINLLRPVYPSPLLPPQLTDDGMLVESGSSAVRLRLPLLRKLRLLNCQRLTGRAIVDVLSERVRWTDAQDPESTLVEITRSVVLYHFRVRIAEAPGASYEAGTRWMYNWPSTKSNQFPSLPSYKMAYQGSKNGDSNVISVMGYGLQLSKHRTRFLRQTAHIFMPLFECPRLLLRKTQPLDGEDILRFHNHPSIAQWININLPKAPHSDNDIAALVRNIDSALFGCVIQDKATSQFIGLAGLVPWRPASDPVNRNVEVFIGLFPEFWGKGYAFEVMVCMIDHAFWEMDMHKVSLTVIEGNERAIQLYKKLGFVDEGRDRQVIWTRGGWSDLLRMGLMENEWDDWKFTHPEAAKMVKRRSTTEIRA